MCPRFGPGTAAFIAGARAGPSRWTHQVGVTGDTCGNYTPTSNAIGLSSLVVFADRAEVAS
jgi:hypothetical protein